MSIIVNWITQIIIFLLIGSIIELLLPNNSLKRYVNIVIGLLLLLMFIKPLFFIFKVDIHSKVTEIEQLILRDDDAKMLEYSLEKQNNEIQSGQDAYILSEIKEQLIQMANPDIVQLHNLHIVNLEFVFLSGDFDKYENLDKVIVMLTEEVTPEQDTNIEQVIINTKETLRPLKMKQSQAIIKLLSEKWEISESQIELVIEGGTS